MMVLDLKNGLSYSNQNENKQGVNDEKRNDIFY